MNEIMTEAAVKTRPRTDKAAPAMPRAKTATILKEHLVEIVSDSGEGAQRCG